MNEKSSVTPVEDTRKIVAPLDEKESPEVKTIDETRKIVAPKDESTDLPVKEEITDSLIGLSV